MKDRVLVAINQADMAMKGKNWDYENNRPNEKLQAFLEEKVQSVKRRVKEATGVDIEPIYYSAGYKEEGEEQRPYNLSKLLYFIVKYTPSEKRGIYVNNINTDEAMWQDDDELMDYGKETRKTIVESVVDGATRGREVGEVIGGILGRPGEVVGGVVGTVIGGVVGFLGGLFG